MRLGELLLFRYHVPRAERFRIDGALRSKWFGSVNEYLIENVVVTNGAAAVFPYTDLVLENLTLCGTVSACTVCVEKSLDVNGDSTVSAPLAMKSGGTISLSRDEDGFSELEVHSINLGSRGTISISDWEGIVCGQSFRVIKSSSVSGVPSGWKARRSDGVLKASLESKSDGLYLNIISGGTRIFVR